MQRTKIIEVIKSEEIGKEFLVKGWVRTRRGNKNVSFIALNDGSTIHNLQIVAEANLFNEDLLRRITSGASLSVLGTLSPSQGAGQQVELLASEINIIGDCDANA